MKYLSQLLVVVWCFVLFQNLSAQTSPDNCLFNAFNDTEAAEVFNNSLRNTTQARTDELLTIPVVIHVMHLVEDTDIGTHSNISAAQIETGLAHLNDAFRNVGAYAGGPYFSDTGILSEDMNIEFCLASIDPEGNTTNGINRIASQYADLAPNQPVSGYGNEDGAIKAQSFWDSHHYLNIWLVNSICSSTDPAPVGCGTSGYALFPYNHGNALDGVVMRSDLWGTSVDNSKVQIHEIGHYLGLYHTFQSGCSEADCMTSGDRVCDTPPDNSTMNLSAGQTVNSCSNDADSANSPYDEDKSDLHENYMDYGNRNLWNTFTPGQKSRMRATLETTRNSLFSQVVCNVAPQSALPLELLSFTGGSEEGIVKLNWTTEYEENMKGFHVQYSESGDAFTTVDFVSANNQEGEQYYSFEEDIRSFTTIYYRLEMLDLSGEISYSEVISIARKKETEWLIFPNPIQGEVLYLQTLEPISGGTYTIFDGRGNKILGGRFEANTARQTFAIYLRNKSKGVYFLEIIEGEKRSFLRFVR